MSSVQSEEECPQCGGSMLCDYYYRTGEEYLICSCCGKYESWTLARNSRGKIILRKNGKAKYKHIKHRGYGVATIAMNTYLEQQRFYALSVSIGSTVLFSTYAKNSQGKRGQNTIGDLYDV